VRLFGSLRAYRLTWFPGDLIAGLMLAAIAVPEQLATARLAGFPAEAGLFAFAAGTLAFAVVGRNPYLSVGGDSTIAPIFAGALTGIVGAHAAAYAPLAGLVALCVGGVLVVAGLARADWIADLLSVPVTIGFLAGIAVHIVVGQLPALLGVAAPAASAPLLARLWQVLQEAGSTNLIDLAIGLGVAAAGLLGVRFGRRIPGTIVGVILATIAATELHLNVARLGTVTVSLPALRMPVAPNLEDLAAVAPLVLVVAAVCMMQTAAVGRSFPLHTADDEDVATSFVAVGAGSVLAGVIGAFAVDASPPRTAFVRTAGGASQLAGLLAVAAVLAVAVAGAPLLALVPQAALAGVLLFVATHVFRLHDALRVARYSRRELTLLVVGGLLVVLLPIQTGMLLAIILSLAHGVQMTMWPLVAELVRVPGTTIWWPASSERHGETVPGILVLAPAAPINFTNAAYIRGRILAAIHAAPSPVRRLVVEASAVTDVDYTGAQTMERTVRELRGRGIDVFIARLLVPHAESAVRRSGLLAVIGADHVFLSVDEAVRADLPALDRAP
jgi:MFS superfamily sulfate permease-like transporter